MINGQIPSRVIEIFLFTPASIMAPWAIFPVCTGTVYVVVKWKYELSTVDFCEDGASVTSVVPFICGCDCLI
jgi:hypothetical protein